MIYYPITHAIEAASLFFYLGKKRGKASLFGKLRTSRMVLSAQTQLTMRLTVRRFFLQLCNFFPPSKKHLLPLGFVFSFPSSGKCNRGIFSFLFFLFLRPFCCQIHKVWIMTKKPFSVIMFFWVVVRTTYACNDLRTWQATLAYIASLTALGFFAAPGKQPGKKKVSGRSTQQLTDDSNQGLYKVSTKKGGRMYEAGLSRWSSQPASRSVVCVSLLSHAINETQKKQTDRLSGRELFFLLLLCPG